MIYMDLVTIYRIDKVLNKRFLYIGLPLKIRDGSGSPIRAVALVEE